ncbi:MAG: geranylgeranylglyceryl/heptaprenylglyceryl phosphate synthase [Sulfolobales archaeon]
MEEYLRKRKADGKKTVFALIDPEKISDDLRDLEYTSKILSSEGLDLFLVGGSLGVAGEKLDEVVKILRETKLPVVLFPGSVAGISKYADAILFISLLNSDEPYYIIGAQVEGGIIVRKLGLEALPTAYIIIGEGGAAGYIGRARPIPWNMSSIALAYAIAAELLGMRLIYLEAGSGVERSVPKEMVSLIRKNTNLYIITGGGIRNPSTACELLEAGSDAIVLGTIIEKDLEKAVEILRTIKNNRCSSSS